MTAVQFSSLFLGSSTTYYIFFSVIEIACTSIIVWYAWKWPKQDDIITGKSNAMNSSVRI